MLRIDAGPPCVSFQTDTGLDWSFARREPGLLDLSLPTSRAIDSGGRPKGVIHNFRTFRMPPDPRIPETAPPASAETPCPDGNRPASISLGFRRTGRESSLMFERTISSRSQKFMLHRKESSSISWSTTPATPRTEPGFELRTRRVACI